MDIKTFRRFFADEVLKTIGGKGYRYQPSNEAFVKSDGEHQFYIYIYMYKPRATYIRIQTKFYYVNKAIEKALKDAGIKPLAKHICGGSMAFISEYYFHKKFAEEYSDFMWTLGEDPSPLIQKWLGYVESIAEPFFKDCTDPKILNAITNGAPLDTSYLNSSYENRVLKFYFIGKRAGLGEEELLRLLNAYEAQLKSFSASYLPGFLEMKRKIWGESPVQK